MSHTPSPIVGSGPFRTGNAVVYATPGGAEISECGTYRYSLWRTWDRTLPRLSVIMTNPSTADADTDDPTIRKVIHFAKRDGCYGGIVVVNLFAYRATEPTDVTAARARGVDIVGPENNTFIEHACGPGSTAPAVLCAWGVHVPQYKHDRARELLRTPELLSHPVPLLCLGQSGGNAPKHPLYIANSQPLVPYLAFRLHVDAGGSRHAAR